MFSMGFYYNEAALGGGKEPGGEKKICQLVLLPSSFSFGTLFPMSNCHFFPYNSKNKETLNFFSSMFES